MRSSAIVLDQVAGLCRCQHAPERIESVREDLVSVARAQVVTRGDASTAGVTMVPCLSTRLHPTCASQGSDLPGGFHPWLVYCCLVSLRTIQR